MGITIIDYAKNVLMTKAIGIMSITEIDYTKYVLMIKIETQTSYRGNVDVNAVSHITMIVTKMFEFEALTNTRFLVYLNKIHISRDLAVY